MMRYKWIVLLILSGALIAALFTFQACKSKAVQCPLCEREIHHHMGVAVTHDGHRLTACCMSCALTYQMKTKNVEIKAATDFLSNDSIDPRTAVYVVDSDVSPCTQDIHVQKTIREPNSTFMACYDRCEPSMLVFSKPTEAEAFQKEHGGKLQR